MVFEGNARAWDARYDMMSKSGVFAIWLSQRYILSYVPGERTSILQLTCARSRSLVSVEQNRPFLLGLRPSRSCIDSILRVYLLGQSAQALSLGRSGWMHFTFLDSTIQLWMSFAAEPQGTNLPFLLGQSAHALANGRSGWMHLVFVPAIDVGVIAWVMAPPSLRLVLSRR